MARAIPARFREKINMNERPGIRVACAALSVFACACVMAGPYGPVPVTHPGWKYGRDNCARFSEPEVLSHALCLKYCERGLQDGHLTPATVGGCYHFCDVHWDLYQG